ncbi:MAG TPA: hypothetical protein QGH71_07800, partial [Candidatus Marinimicrobia bacterium]|nr:hypothetical protein [Candidatus Neomarinimicrobiota bacterium]
MWKKITDFLTSGYAEQVAAPSPSAATKKTTETSTDLSSNKEDGMTHTISMTVNGKSCSGEVESRQLLVHFLRDQLLLTGTHVGCDTS